MVYILDPHFFKASTANCWPHFFLQVACYKNNEEGFYEMKLPPQHDLSSTQQIAETNFEIKQKIVAAHWHALMEMLWRMYFGIISTLC